MRAYLPGKCAQCRKTGRLSTTLFIKGRKQGRLCDECAAMQQGLGESREGPAKPPLVTQEAKEAPERRKDPITRKPRRRVDYTKPEVVVRGDQDA